LRQDDGKKVNLGKTLGPAVDMKSLNLEFINSISKGVSDVKQSKDQGKMNLNIMIGNNNVKVTNQNLRNNGSLGPEGVKA
jgi:hypothetical protein